MLEEANQFKEKHKIGCRVYDGFIQQLLEQIGRSFIQGTVAAYETDKAEK